MQVCRRPSPVTTRVRLLAWVAALLTAGVGGALYVLAEAALLRVQHWTGWLLVLGLALLAVHGIAGLRRRAASGFLLVHLHLGWLTVLGFFAHAGAPPGPGFHLALWLAFVLVAMSGALGYGLERLGASRQRDSEALPYPRIAERRAVLAAEAQAAFGRIVARQCPSLLAGFFAQRLVPFFAAPAHPWHHWLASVRPLRELLLEFDFVGAALVDDSDLARIREIIVQKSELDRRWALYWLQRGWLFVHLPASGVLTALLPLHILSVHAFGG